MSQSELADAAGVSRNTIGNIESGHTPQEDVLRRVFAALGVETDGDAFEEDVDAQIRVIGRMLERLDPETREETVEAILRVIALAMGKGVSATAEDAKNVTPITRKPIEDMTVDELEAERKAATHDESDPQEYPEG